MIAVSQAFRDAVRLGKPQRAVLKFEDATFTNEDISMTSGGITFYERFNESTDMTMGAAPSSSIRVRLINRDGVLDDFPFGKFVASIGACVEESTYETYGNAMAEYKGRIFTGHSEPPYLREDGAACRVQPDFPVVGLLIDGDRVYCVGPNGEIFSFVITSTEYIVVAGTWGYRHTQTWRELLAMTWYRVMQDATTIEDEALYKKLIELSQRRYSITFEENTVTEWWSDGIKRVYELVKLGTFIAPRPAILKKRVIDMEADDQMTLFDEMWAKDLPIQYPVTLGGLLSAICSQAGVVLKTPSFLNSDMIVDEQPEDFEDATVREVVAWIAEAACGYARFDRDGLLEIVWFNPTTQQYDEHDYTDFTPYSYQVQPVQQLNIRNQNSNAEAILGEGENAYMIQDNPFLRQDDSAEAEAITGEAVKIMQVPGSASDVPSPIAAESGIKSISGNADRSDSEPAPIAAESGITPIYNRLAGFAPFNPSSVDLLTDWSVQAGDMVNVASGSDTYSLPVYSMTMNWNGSPKITLESSGNETRDPLPKFERQLFSAGHGGYGNALAVKDLKYWAERMIDEEHGLIVDQAGRLDEQGNRIVTVERSIDGMNETITDMAGDIDENGKLIEGAQQIIDGINETITQQAGKIDEQGELISGAQRQIDGINKSIEDIAGDVDQVTGALSGVRERLDGAEKTITQQAGEISKQGELISGVELTLNGKEGEIGLIARMAGAETSIQQNKDAIALRAVKSDVDAQFQVQAGQISSKVSAGGIASAINQTAQSVLIQASKIDLKGYVTATALTTNYLNATYLASTVGSILSAYAGKLSAENLHFDSAEGLEATINDLTSESIYSTSISGDHIYAGEIDLGTHYHTFTVDGGTVTIGGPSATAGSFKIADTQFYKDGVSAAEKAVNIEKWSTGTYNDTMQTIPVYAELSNGKRGSYDVSTVEPFTAGFLSGQASASGKTISDVRAYSHNSSKPKELGVKVYFDDNTDEVYYVDATLVYNAVGVDSWTTSAYDSANKKYTITANLSNGKEAIHNVYCSVPYNEGYEAGKADAGSDEVTLSGNWGSGSTNTSNTFTVSASNGKSVKQAIYLTGGSSFSNGHTRVYMRSVTSGGTIRAQIQVDLPDSATNWNLTKLSSTQVRVTCRVGGKLYTSEALAI